jgi:site-specific recombinase XerD
MNGEGKDASTAIVCPPEPPGEGGGTAVTLWTESSQAARTPSSALVAWSGERAAFRTVEFLTAGIHNPHTRRAYTRAARRFLAWCNARGMTLADVRSPDVALYVQELGTTLAPLSVKQHLAALKHWFDWLVTGHVLEVNPAHAVRGPRYSQNIGKTPVLEKDEARTLLSSMDAATVVGARDAALVAVLLFSWARIGALVAMRLRDYRGAGTPRATLLLHEKNGKDHVVPVHHRAAEILDAYIAMAGLTEGDAPLWQNAPGHGGRLSGQALSERGALGIVKRRCRAAGLPADICNHSFRATGMTLYMDAGGDLESARQLANHASVKTTQLYNRSGDRKRKAEVERVQL